MSIGSTQPFRPAGTAQVAASTTSSSVLLNGGGDAVLVYNSSSAVAFIKFGVGSSLQATNQDLPVPPGTRMLVHVGGPFVTTAAAILSAGAGTVYFTRGDGTIY
ncbi:MAG: hypothetical protein JO047_04840 [Alphaproteobacteria bacterium]|nr:hypothetical protein [Alphaproteobacteria bacterium]